MTTAVAFAACRIVRHFFVTDQAFHCDVDSPFFLSREIACVDAPRRSYLLFPDVDRAELMTNSEMGQLCSALQEQIRIGFTHLVLIPEGLRDNGIVAI